MNTFKSILPSIKYCINIAIGTEAGRKCLRTRQIQRCYGVNGENGEHGARLYMDFAIPHLSQPPGMNGDPEAALLHPQDFVRTVLPDAESLRAADEAGLLYFTRSTWVQDLAAARDNRGSASDPRAGWLQVVVHSGALAQRIREAMKWFASFDRRQQLAVDGTPDASANARLVVNMHISFPGGTGNGAVYGLLDLIRDCAQLERVDVKVLVNGTLLETLATHDREQALVNQTTLLKELQALSTGRCVNILTGERIPPAFHGVVLASNRNNHGNLDNHDKVQGVQAHYAFWQENTPAGELLDERTIDLEGHGPDEYGDPRCGISPACSVLHLDKQRVFAFNRDHTIAHFAARLLLPIDVRPVRQDALHQARALGLIESEEMNQLSHPVLHPEALEGESVARRLDEIFTDRVSSATGLAGATARKNAIESIRGRDFPSGMVPAMTRQGEAMVKKMTAAIDGRVDHLMKRTTGIAESTETIDTLKKVVHMSHQAVNRKTGLLRQHLDPWERMVKESLDRLEQVRRRNWAMRKLSGPLIAQLNNNLDQAGRMVLKIGAELQAMDTAAWVLDRVDEYLDRKLQEVLKVRRQLEQIHAWAMQRVHRHLHSVSSYWAPVGEELAVPSFLQGFYERFCGSQGGTDKLCDDLLGEFLGTHGTIGVFGPLAESEIRTQLEALCGKPFQKPVEQLDVLEVFAQRYPTRQLQETLIRQRVQESEGAVPVVGDADKASRRIKIAVVPDEARAAAFVKLIDAVDEDETPWRVVSSRDTTSVVLMQMLNRISLAPFISRANLDGPEHWARLVATAPNPVTALMPNVKPGDAAVKRAMLKGILTGRIRPDDSKGLILLDADDSPRPLGTTAEMTAHNLGRDYGTIVWIESLFAHRLGTDRDEIEVRLNSVAATLSEQAADAGLVAACLDQRAVAEVRYQIDLLEPYLNRVRAAMNYRRKLAAAAR
jgi:hypothetical protein